MLVFPLPLQGESMDSLYVVFQNADRQQKAEKANLLLKRLRQEGYCDTLMQFDRSTKVNVIEAHTFCQMSLYYLNQDHYKAALQAIENARNSLSGIKDDHLHRAVLGTLARSHLKLGNYEQALESVIAAYNIDTEDNELISQDLNTFAAIHLALSQPRLGINRIEPAIALERQMKHTRHLAMRLSLASELYLMNNQTTKAMAAIKEAHEIDSREGRTNEAAIRLVQMGAVLEAMSMFSEARDTLSNALRTLERGNSAYHIAKCNKQLGDIALESGHHQEAVSHYKTALEQSIRCGAPNIELNAEHGLWLAMREDNPSVALLHLERYAILNDSLQQRRSSTLMKVMNSSASNQALEGFNDSTPYNRKLLIVAGSLLSLMALITLVTLFYAWRRNKKALQLQRHAHDIRTRFIDNATHEIHTPLTIIMDAGQQLREGTITANKECRRMGNMIYNYAESMLGIVNQALELQNARDARNAPNGFNSDIEQGDIVLFVRCLVDNLVETARQKEILLEFAPTMSTLTMSFSTESIRKIIHLLVTNAMKFTPANGVISVKLDQTEKDHLVLKVADNGKGIPVGERERIFEPFNQGNANYEGVDTVMDLTLVNMLVHNMNGDISVDSTPEKGTTFTISLPIPLANKQEPPKSEATWSNEQKGSLKQKPLVFIVDNNPDVAYFFANSLRQDYDLRIANDGEEALNNARELVPDLIITNIMMPVMDGKELIRQLRQDETVNHIPIIVMTSNPSAEERISCMQAGADLVLARPCKTLELTTASHHLIHQYASLRKRFANISDESTERVVNKEDSDFINRLVDIIHVQTSKGNIDMEQIAAAMSISRKQLRERVTSITGLTPVAFALQVRLNRARRMVSNEDTPLTTIAHKCGFQTLSHFSSSFKQQFGVSPQQYRKHMGDINGTK